MYNADEQLQDATFDPSVLPVDMADDAVSQSAEGSSLLRVASSGLELRKPWEIFEFSHVGVFRYGEHLGGPMVTRRGTRCRLVESAPDTVVVVPGNTYPDRSGYRGLSRSSGFW